MPKQIQTQIALPDPEPKQILVPQLVGHKTALPRYRQHWAKIYYIEPVYLQNGKNGCRIYYDDGFAEEIPARLSYVLQKLACQIHISLEALRQQSLHWLEGKRKHNLPLVINEYFLLLPVIARRRRRKNDSTLGYVVQQKIASLTALPEGGTVLTFLTNPHRVKVLNNVHTVRRNVVLGLTLQQRYVDTLKARTAEAMAGLMVQE